MSQRLRTNYLTIEEYLDGERDAEVRREYVAGQVYAMAGTSDRHNRIALNFASRLDSHLQGGPCETFISDMKLFVTPHSFYYPDVMVACDQPVTDSYFRTQPVLIVEVISPTTARTDSHEKLAAYTSIPSLVEYAIVMQDRIEIELHRREDQSWRAESYSDLTETITFNSINLSLSVNQIYRNVRFGLEA